MEPSTSGYFQDRGNHGPSGTDRTDQAQSAGFGPEISRQRTEMTDRTQPQTGSLRPEDNQQQGDMAPNTSQGNLQSTSRNHPGRADTERTDRTARTQRTQTQQSAASLAPELSKASTTASGTITKMTEDPSTAYKMANVISQLDPEAKAQLQELVGDFDKSRKNRTGDRPQGQVASPDYHEQNPWHAQDKKPTLGLAEPLPRRESEIGGRETARSKDRPVFSLGEPLPHTVRKSNRPDTSRQREDVEQGLHKRPSATPAAESDESGETLSATKQTSLGQYPQKPKSGQDEGTDMARKFQVDADTIGGQREDSAVEEGKLDPNELRNWWARFRAKYPEPLAEFLCTTMSVFLGLCGTLSVNLSQNQSKQYGTYETSCWAWGLAFMFGIYLGGGVSGAHMNPAISISLSVYRGFPWKRCGVYVVIQLLGALTGGGLAYCLYHDAILQVDPTLTTTYSSWFTVPQTWVTPASAFFSEFLAAAVVMVAVLSLGDDQNNPPGAGMHAFIIGLLITVLKMTLGYNTGAALSPASDLGPRLVALAVGYQTDDLFKTGWWAYGPWGGNLSGALVGCALYDAVVFVGSESPINYNWSKEKHPWRVAFHKN